MPPTECLSTATPKLWTSVERKEKRIFCEFPVTSESYIKTFDNYIIQMKISSESKFVREFLRVINVFQHYN